MKLIVLFGLFLTIHTHAQLCSVCQITQECLSSGQLDCLDVCTCGPGPVNPEQGTCVPKMVPFLNGNGLPYTVPLFDDHGNPIIVNGVQATRELFNCTGSLSCFGGWTGSDCSTPSSQFPCTLVPNSGCSASCHSPTCPPAECGIDATYLANPPLCSQATACTLPTNIVTTISLNQTLNLLFYNISQIYKVGSITTGACTVFTSIDEVIQGLCDNNLFTIDRINVKCMTALPGLQTCLNGWTGPGCTISCPGHSCQNGGVCQQSGSTASCACQPQFRGPSCQYACPTDDNGNICSGNGQCTLAANGTLAVCACNSGWVGPACQYNCAANCNGQKDCTYPGTGGTSHAVQCHCPQGIVGTQCQYNCQRQCGGNVRCSTTACDTLQCECSGFGQLVQNIFTSAFDVCMCNTGYSGFQCEKDCTNQLCGAGQISCLPAPPYTIYTCTNGHIGCISGFSLNANNQCI